MHKMREAVLSGLTAEGAVERCNPTPAPASCALPIPICASAARSGRSGQPAAARTDRPHPRLRAGRPPGERHSGGSNMSPRRCWIMTAPAFADSCSKRAAHQPRHHRRPRLGIAAVGPGGECVRPRGNRRPVIVDGAGRRGASAPAWRRGRGLCRGRSASAPAGRPAMRRCARSRASPGRRGHRPQSECRLLVDLPHIEEDRRRRHRPVPHRMQFMVASTFPRISEQLTLYRRAGCSWASGPSPSVPRHRRRQGAALYADGGGREPRLGLARHPPRHRPPRPAAQPDPRLAAAGAGPVNCGMMFPWWRTRASSTKPRRFWSAN